jgi:hypothetical protein
VRRPADGLRRRRLGFERLEPRQMLAAANLLITEFMATNVSTVLSGDFAYDDWIEVYNADTVPVNLGDYFLTDNDGILQKWAFPSISLNPGSYLVVFASAPLDGNGEVIDNYVDGFGYYHTNFKLDSAGEDLALTYEDPISHAVSVVHDYAPEFPEQFPDVSYGIASDSMLRYFDVPTPGGPNGAGLLGVVEDTQFSVDRGFYDDPIQVEITSDTPGAAIYYTTDGTAPTPSTGTLYSGALTIDHTTVLRAIATKDDYLSTNVDTQTYLFLDDIVSQSVQTALDAGYPSQWIADNGTYTADYGFDTDVIGTFDANGNPQGSDLYGGIYADRIQDDLLAIPTISIVLDPDDMFENGPVSDRGIYIDPRKTRNLFPERATSVEWITPDGSAEMQVDAGIQIQGGAFRSQFFTLKHSFRLVFKDEYGPTELTFPLFGPEAVDQFNTVVLKATANDGYSWRSAQPSDGPATLQYTRDQFGHSLQQDMGYASPHDAYAHLYINGKYWGVFYAQERPDAEFAESYLGINPDNWDGLHAPDDDDNDPPDTDTGDLNAWYAMFAKTAQAGSSLAAYMELQGLNLDGTPDPSTAPLLDVDNYIDYLIINAWGGNDDWPHHNWWAGRDRNPDTTEGFQFFLWDYDGVMGNSRGWSPLDTKTFNQGFTSPVDNNVGEPHNNLQTNPEYQLAFADRVQKWFFNDGILTPDSLIARYQEIADRVEQVMVAESARWGDMNSPTPTPIVLSDWEAERDWLLNTYLPQRSAIVMDEMREYGFYPDTDAPTFSQHGGYVPSGFDLTLSAPEGTIYYTLDGSDPRLVGGAINGGAFEYTGTPIEISGAVTVKARALNGGEWSALNEANFTTAAPGDVTKLRITELHYHPADHAGVADDEDLEFLEVLNTDSAAVSLDGVEIAGFANTPYAFDSGLVLIPGQRIVVARSPAVFQLVYGTEINLAPTGYSDSNLSNGGESVILRGPGGQVLQSFTYSDDPPWPTSPDGTGPSLEIIDALGNSSDPTNWRASLYYGGSPGTAGLPIPGDYDGNATVEEADFLTWRAAYGTSVAVPGSGSDGNGNGMVDAADYSVWRDNLGNSIPPLGPGAGGGAGAGAASAALEVLTAPPAPTAAIDRAVATLEPPAIKPPRVSRGAAPIRQIVGGATLDEDALLLLAQSRVIAQDAANTADGRASVEPTEAAHQEEMDELFAGLDAAGEYVASVGF